MTAEISVIARRFDQLSRQAIRLRPGL